jgi:hypothetical protein
LGQTFQTGEQYAACPECRFKGGAGFSFSLGMLYEWEIFRGIRLGALGVYNDFSFLSKFQETEMLHDPESGAVLPFEFFHEGHFKLNSLIVAPYTKFYPWDFVFFRMGLPISYIFSNNFKHDKILVSRSISQNGITYAVKADDTTVEDGEIIGLNQIQIFLSTALGFDFRLSKNIYLSPIFEYYIPFTELSSNGDASKINNWKINFELRVALKERSR